MHAHPHPPGHGHHEHAHLAKGGHGRAFAIGIILNLGFVAIEAGYGIWADSMALLSDAGHNLSDVLGLAVAWGASLLARRSPTDRFTYGPAVGGIVWESVTRLIEPAPVAAGTVMIVAAIGIVVNGLTAFLFMNGQHDLNIRGAFLHMVADAAVSLGVVLGGLCILWTGATWIDPALSLVIAAVIVWGTWDLLKQSLTLSLLGVPRGIAVPEVRRMLEEMPGVARVHHLHVWAVSTTETALTAHLVMPSGHPGDGFLAAVQRKLNERFGIGHATLQIEIHGPGSRIMTKATLPSLMSTTMTTPTRGTIMGDTPSLEGIASFAVMPYQSGFRLPEGLNAMPRALLIVLDSVGIGGAEDAGAYGDTGADTVGHIAEACAAGRGDQAGLREGPLQLPHMTALGLGLACEASTGRMPPNLAPQGPLKGAWGYGVETSKGKDTPSGHWEITGVPVAFDWGYFPDTVPTFPAELTAALIERGNLPGILGDKHASGTTVIDEFGAEHMRTGKPIFYTSVDSVLQIAAHEETFGLQRLYKLCRIGRELCDGYNIGRVIARPFVGSPEAGFKRTGNRKDFATPPPADTILDTLTKAGRSVVTVGKIGDIFAHRSTGREIKPNGNDACLSAAIAAMGDLADGGFVFANLVDFDSEFGHRRDIPGYAAALEAFDRRIPEIEAALQEGDLVIITADHGNDPSWRGSDHTREHVPILSFGPGVKQSTIGRRESFADIGASVLAHLGVRNPGKGTSWL